MTKNDDKLVNDTLLQLSLILVNDNYYSLEQLSSELNVSPKIIHKAFMILKTKSGWSITVHNKKPYWRDSPYIRTEPRLNRGRKKGEKYQHDQYESDWERTLYKIRKPM